MSTAASWSGTPSWTPRLRPLVTFGPPLWRRGRVRSPHPSPQNNYVSFRQLPRNIGVPMTTSSEMLLVENDGPVRILTLNNPEMLNAMVDELHEALTDIWVDLSRDRDARAVIITGAGRAFSAGGNVPAFDQLTNDLDYRRANMRTAKMLVDNILGSHLPVI